jgi:ZIP family zinc transporter
MVEYLSHFNLVWLGIVSSLCAGLATGLGSIPIFFTRKISKKLLDVLLGAAAGIMLAATSFSLIVPAIEKAYCAEEFFWILSINFSLIPICFQMR